MILQEIINITDGVNINEVKNYCECQLKDERDKYPRVRSLSNEDVTDIMRDSSVVRKLFLHNCIMVGVEKLIPSLENCNKHVFFADDYLFAVPVGGTTALATCAFMPSSKSLIMYIGLHGDLTPELVVAFFLSFIPEATNHRQQYTQLRIILNILSSIDLDATNKLLQNIQLYEEDVLIRNQRVIGIDSPILSAQL